METTCLFTPVNHAESARWAMQTIFLALLLNPKEGSPKTVATGASKSNLFFSRMFGASAEPRFALVPKSNSTF